jgi:hypothetical protein
MKRLIILSLLFIGQLSVYAQSLSKEETIEYIKKRLITNTSLFVECHDGVPCVEDINNVWVEDGTLFFTKKDSKVKYIIKLDKKFEAYNTFDCADRVWKISPNSFKLVITEENVKSLCKALNHLSELCVDPFK